MNKILSAVLLSIMILSPITAQAKTNATAKAHAICKDNTISYSINRSGTCSHHKGVKKWLY